MWSALPVGLICFVLHGSEFQCVTVGKGPYLLRLVFTCTISDDLARAAHDFCQVGVGSAKYRGVLMTGNRKADNQIGLSTAGCTPKEQFVSSRNESLPLRFTLRQPDRCPFLYLLQIGFLGEHPRV